MLKGTHLLEAWDKVSQEIQDKIIESVGDTIVRRKQSEYCFPCTLWIERHGCTLHLFPITSNGKPCSYKDAIPKIKQG